MSFSQAVQTSRKLCWPVLKYSKASTRGGGQPDLIAQKLTAPIDWDGNMIFPFEEHAFCHRADTGPVRYVRTAYVRRLDGPQSHSLEQCSQRAGARAGLY